MKISTATFVKSSATYTQGPRLPKPEIALIGRSNVGKSSLINMLLQHKQLAKTSNKPGKTQLMNHFLVNSAWYLVDLPGYGWAQVSRSKRQTWSKMVADYLLHSRQLLHTMVLIDARHKPQALDITFINWLGARHIPFSILLTKIDKIARHQVQKRVNMLQHALSSSWEVTPPMLLTSSHTGAGREPLLYHLQETLNTYNTPTAPEQRISQQVSKHPRMAQVVSL